MQLINAGPDVPDSLLEAHEEGRVVFFCGAGISYPSGLGGFGWLVEKLIQELGYHKDHELQEAICKKQFDIAIGLLESHLVVGRAGIRSKIKEILTPDPNKINLDTHNALLTLAKTRKSNQTKLRLITTNFDRLFEEIPSIKSYKAPLLPVPKLHWDGLVYLHGLLPENETDSDLDNLVVSSGDFGLAYLMEGWAARFICELFRNFNVVFVGYSIDDPVLRYMVDALSADKLRGEDPLEMFSFCPYSEGDKDRCVRKWQAKNVIPIPYQEDQNHEYLHKTLHKWSEIYRDGIFGKERIVNDIAPLLPGNSTQSDDYLSRLIWALSDPTGKPAKQFAEFNPAPSLDWLEPFSENRFDITDLKRFGINPMDSINSEISFSLLNRPTPYPLAPNMAISDRGDTTVRPDEVMRQMSQWLTRHLDKPELLLWLVKEEGRVSAFMKRQIKNKLREIDQQEPNNDPESNNLDEIPDDRMLRLWNLLLAGYVKNA
ncbi:MAG: SIR2 family protein [Paracoccaceae bacterium]|nr:SIR2 family protein [Paracoccaceae bacterium]MDE2915782.1 SIR2 family protein [Paracoccaceae bacterium]